MKFIREYVDKDSAGKSRIFVDAECQVCLKIFKREKRLFKTDICSCSIKCNNVAKGKTLKISCYHCKIEFYRAASKVSAPKSGLNFCSRECKEVAQTYVEDIMPSHYYTSDGSSTYREKAFKHYKPVCSDCGYANVLALEVHHIDRDRANNLLENLVILCANCHSIRHKTGL